MQQFRRNIRNSQKDDDDADPYVDPLDRFTGGNAAPPTALPGVKDERDVDANDDYADQL